MTVHQRFLFLFSGRRLFHLLTDRGTAALDLSNLTLNLTSFCFELAVTGPHFANTGFRLRNSYFLRVLTDLQFL